MDIDAVNNDLDAQNFSSSYFFAKRRDILRSLSSFSDIEIVTSWNNKDQGSTMILKSRLSRDMLQTHFSAWFRSSITEIRSIIVTRKTDKMYDRDLNHKSEHCTKHLNREHSLRMEQLIRTTTTDNS